MSLKAFFDDIVTNAAIEYDNPEIQDINSAVAELVQRYAQQFKQYAPVFRLQRIELCGSVAEKTGIWKTKLTRWIDKGPFAVDEPIPFIEFDYLAILEKTTDMKISEWCAGCKSIKDSYGINIYNELRRLDKLDLDEYQLKFDREILRNTPGAIDKLFKDCFRKSMVSICCCLHVEKQKHLGMSRYSMARTTKEDSQRNCDKCIVSRKTGFPQLESESSIQNCSFILSWTSKVNSLLAPNFSSLIKSKQMNKLSIHVDLLPAFELVKDNVAERRTEHECFIVAKRCSINRSNIRNWRQSFCRSEVLFNQSVMSEGHRKCQMIIKYLFEQLNLRFEVSPWLNGYHGKIAVLNHSKTCLRDDKGFTKCVIAIISDLQVAYANRSLKAYCGRGNLLATYPSSGDKAEILSCLLNVLDAIKSKIKTRWRLKPWRQKLYSSEQCIKIFEKFATENKI